MPKLPPRAEQISRTGTSRRGPLTGIKIIELAGLGPAPFAAMMLADMGAGVLRIERQRAVTPGRTGASWDLLNRSRRSVGVDLKHARGIEVVLRLVAQADVLIEGFRPGVMERLGLGPDVCFERNARLVYGRMTGYGQTGPLAERAGHDIDYIAIAGALEPIGRAGGPPVPPLNLLGDFGGGGMLLVSGVLAALVERAGSGHGQVVDAAMVDGAALLCTMLHSLRQANLWNGARGENLLDTGAPFYDVYETRDHLFVAVGALEPVFYAELLEKLSLTDDPRFIAQLDAAKWPEMRAALRAIFLQKTRDEWCAVFEGSDACVAPVLSPGEAAEHPHHAARRTFQRYAGAIHPSPAPRFSRTPGALQGEPALPGAHTDAALSDWGFTRAELDALHAEAAIA
jgi:alpha-methylacyl-CoA racemase